MKLRRLLSLALALAGLWLVAFHAALFWQRIADATILQSGVLGRWLASALLVAGLVAFRKHLHGRRALVFWVMVALLHATIPAEERILNPAENIAALIQLGLVVLPAGLVALGLFEAKARPSFVARLDRGSKPLRSFDPASLRAPRSPPPSDSSFH